jgi:hypothetical protein
MGDNKALAAAFERAMRDGDMVAMAKAVQDLLADDFVQEWPQSGERLSKEASIRLAAAYGEQTGTGPRLAFKRMLAGGDLLVFEGTMDYGDGIPVSYVGVGEIRDGKLARMTEYFANPFPAPDWRKPFVEPA